MTTTSTDQFEDRLLQALRAVVEANPVPVTTLAPSRRSRRRPVVVGGVITGVAVTATSVLAGGGAAAAYAVSPHSDGSVSVTINSLKDAAGLQSKLAAVGIKAVVDYLPGGKACQQPRYQPVSGGAQGSLRVDSSKGGRTTFTLSNGQVAPGDTLVIESSGGVGFSSIGVGVASGVVAPCRVVDAPMPPAGGDGAVPLWSRATAPSRARARPVDLLS